MSAKFNIKSYNDQTASIPGGGVDDELDEVARQQVLLLRVEPAARGQEAASPGPSLLLSHLGERNVASSEVTATQK